MNHLSVLLPSSLYNVLTDKMVGKHGILMIKTLIKSGNSLALVLDKALLQLLNIDESTPVRIEFDGKRLIVTPADAKSRRAFETAKAKSHGRFSKAYQRLAE